MAPSAALLPGNLDLVILEAISVGAVHGYGVLLRIEHIVDAIGQSLTATPPEI